MKACAHFNKGVSVCDKEIADSGGTRRPICCFMAIVGVHTQRYKTASSKRQEVSGKETPTHHPTVVRVHIKASKTDPFQQGVYVYLGATGNDLCPVAAVSAYLAVRGRKPGPFFRFACGTALTQEALVKQLRSALAQFDVDVSQYLGHSFRIGAATTVAAVGLEDSLIKTLGCWQSVAYQL